MYKIIKILALLLQPIPYINVCSVELSIKDTITKYMMYSIV